MADDVATPGRTGGGDFRLCPRPGDQRRRFGPAGISFALCGFQAVHAGRTSRFIMWSAHYLLFVCCWLTVMR